MFGLMYVGSQATKLPRAAGMLALAPLVDSGMVAAQNALGLQSKQTVRPSVNSMHVLKPCARAEP